MERLPRFISCPVLRLLLLLSLCSAATAAPSDDFRSGVAAFGEQNYESALRHFIAARDGGMRAATLHYNLGATYFHLGRFDESKAEFDRLTSDSAWRALAHYNLGLIDETQGRHDAAADHFRQAVAVSTNEKLRVLAAERLDSALAALAATRERGWQGLLSAAAGHDDNVLLSNDRGDSPSNRQDWFADFNAVAGRYVAGSLDDGWRLDFAGYFRGYFDLNDYNFGVGSAAATYSRLFDAWYIEAGPRVEAQLSGDDYLASVGSIRVQALRPKGAWILRLRSEYARYEPASQYDYIGGSQLRAGFDFTRRLPRTRLRMAFEFELNDRRDLAAGGEYFSYSPRRHKVAAEIKRQLIGRLQIEGRVEYRASRYRTANAENVGNATLTTTRSDDRLSGSAKLSYETAAVGAFFLDFHYADNDSTFERYDYASSQVSIGIDYTF
jgi:tetratricopeptide (TPR) repeat protein